MNDDGRRNIGKPHLSRRLTIELNTAEEKTSFSAMSNMLEQYMTSVSPVPMGIIVFVFQKDELFTTYVVLTSIYTSKSFT